MIKKINITTKERYQLIDITDIAEGFVEEAKINNGFLFVFSPHSTVGIVITENEENLKKDWVNFFEEKFSKSSFLHDRIDNNADSHIISGILGQGKYFMVEKNKIFLGNWQKIFLFELDGPREREVVLKISTNNS